MSKDFKPDPAGFAALERALAYGMLNLGLFIEGEAKAQVPYKTGNLRRSIHTAAFAKGVRIYGATDDNGKAIPAYVGPPTATAFVVVGTNAGYGVFVELGTIHMRAQPYLGPALARARPQAQQIVLAGMKAHTSQKGIL